MQVPSWRRLSAVSCGEAEPLHSVSDFNGFKPRGKATDLALLTGLLLYSFHRISATRAQ